MKRVPKILLVEDRRIARNTIREMLSGLNYQITEVESGEKALKALAKIEYDAIILDIKLPGISGIELLKRAREKREILSSVVVLTDHAKYAFDAGKLEAFCFVAKTDLDPDAFKEILVAAVNHKRQLGRVKVKHCFKHNQPGCSISFGVQSNLVFIGIPFRMKKVYEDGIKPLFTSFNLNASRSDELRRSGDFSCKICGMIQACQLAIFDISTLSPNVLIELGFAFALGKEVIILKNKKTKMPSNLSALEPVEYTSIAELRRKLELYLEEYKG